MATLILDTATNTLERSIPDKYANIPGCSILQASNPILRKIAPKFDFSLDDSIELAYKLKKSINPNLAFGLAAPQIGIETQAFIMRNETEYFYIFNPEILNVSEQTNKEKESCLSDPFLFLVVSRPNEIEVAFQNEQGERKQMKIEGFAARVFMHEYDHLNGVLFTDHVKPVALKLARDKQKKVLKKIK